MIDDLSYDEKCFAVEAGVAVKKNRARYEELPWYRKTCVVCSNIARGLWFETVTRWTNPAYYNEVKAIQEFAINIHP